MTGVAVGVVVDNGTGAEVTGAVTGGSVSALMGVLVASCTGFDVGAGTGAIVGASIGACVAAASHVAGGSEDKLQMPSLIHVYRTGEERLRKFWHLNASLLERGQDEYNCSLRLTSYPEVLAKTLGTLGRAHPSPKLDDKSKKKSKKQTVRQEFQVIAVTHRQSAYLTIPTCTLLNNMGPPESP
jgi:hypothetical protein